MKAVEKKRYISIVAFVIILAMVVTIAGLYFYNSVNWADYPDFGYGFRSATGIRVIGVVTNHGQRAGLKIGDRLAKVNGKEFGTIEEFRGALHRSLGEQNTYLVERDGHPFEITITNVPSGFSGSFARSGFPFLLGLSYFIIGVLVFMMKPHQRSSWIFFLLTSTFGLFFAFMFNLGVMRPCWLERANIFTYTFTPAAIIHLALSFPEERQFIQKHPSFQVIPYFVSLLIFLLIGRKTPTLWGAPKPWLFISVAYMATGALFFWGSCIQLWRCSSSEIVKLRSKMILLGSAITLFIPVLDYISDALLQSYVFPNFNYYLPFFIAFPLCVGYSIVKHDLFDIDAIIKRTYGYVLTTMALAGIYGLVVLVSNLAFGGFEFAKSPIFPLVFILAVVFLFNPIRNRVQKFIDRVFYRLEYDYRETLQKISETMRSLLDQDAICKSIMKFALEPMFVDSGAVMILSKDKNEYECFIQTDERGEPRNATEVKVKATLSDERAVFDDEIEKEGQIREEIDAPAQENHDLTLSVDDPLIQKVAELQKEVTLYDIQEDPFFETDREACEQAFDRLGATLIVPLIYEERLSGLISLGRKKSGKFYRKEDVNLLNTLANQGAVAIENARLVDEVIEKQRMEEELAIGRELQVSMLPSNMPQVKGFEIAAYSLAAREVGGDFYDFIEMGDNKAGLLIGDVTGKSVSGALVMSASRTLFRTLAEDELGVKKSMMRANRRLKKDVKSGMFVALLYAVLNGQDKTLTMCSAGQTQPVLLSAKTGEADLVQTEGDTFPLGLLEDADYGETRLPLMAGDKVIFYTDGVVEAMNEQEDMFGFERLLRVIQTAKSKSADSLLKEIIQKVQRFAGKAPQHDDLTLIVLSVED
ncbi:MAG: SpoIIE family protein phosphatase [Desulfobacterales bacterium]|nr:MAG: SpoIIE family protein phosphatase [Desulfobacterales bacterium]